MAASR
jgi:hypothetical protein